MTISQRPGDAAAERGGALAHDGEHIEAGERGRGRGELHVGDRVELTVDSARRARSSRIPEHALSA